MSRHGIGIWWLDMKTAQARTASGLIVVCLSLVVGCTETARETEQGSPNSEPSAGAESRMSPEIKMKVDEQLAFAVSDLAQRLGVEEDTIGAAAVRQVTWRSGALGCPEPGLSYTQALVPGLLIILQVGEEGYGYHARQGGQPFYCPRERVEMPISSSAEDVA
jgi:hypothetical protein